MVPSSLILLLVVGGALCQYDSPVPPRLVVPRGRVRAPRLEEPTPPPPPRSRTRIAHQRAPIPVPVLPPPKSIDHLPLIVEPEERQYPQPAVRPPLFRSQNFNPPFRPQPTFRPIQEDLSALPKVPPTVRPVEELPPQRPEPAFRPVEEPPAPPKPQPPVFRPIEDFPPPRPKFRNSIEEDDDDEEEEELPRKRIEAGRTRPGVSRNSINRGIQQQQQQQQGVPVRQKSVQVAQQRPTPHQSRARKPTAQVIRKYREDNPDGSITWGFENDDGTYKEETIGVDCVTRGKYGYYDPDGVRREYTYISGIPCERNQPEEEDAEPQGSDHGYIDYTNNKYVKANGETIDISSMVKNRARKPIQYNNNYNYRN